MSEPKQVDAGRTIGDLEAMLQKDGENPQLLRELAQVCAEQQQWDGHIDALGRLHELAGDADSAMELGDAIRQHGSDPLACIDAYNRVLDADSGNVVPLAIMENLLTEATAWERLDDVYRRQLARLPGNDTPGKIIILKKLLDMYRSSEMTDQAAEALRLLADMDHAAAADYHMQRGALYLADREHWPHAMVAFEDAVRSNPFDPEPYQRLFELNYNLEQFDKAFVHTAALHYLHGGDATAREFFNQQSPDEAVEAMDILGPELWHGAVTPEQGRSEAGQICSVLYHHVDNIVLSHPKKAGLHKHDHLPLTESLNFCSTVGYVNSIIDAPLPKVYLQSGQGERISVAPVYPGTIVIPTNAFENYPQQDLLFHIGRAATLARPSHVLATVYRADKLRAWLEAAVTVIDEQYRPGTDEELLASMRKNIARGLPRKQRPVLEKYVERFVALQDSFDFGQWYRSIFFTANRAGLIVCNDLSCAMGWVEAYGQGESEQWVQDQKADLLRFWISEEYAYIRRLLGFSIV